MRQLVFIFLLPFTLLACSRAGSFPETAVREMCEQMVAQYPEANLQDVYKTCYQDFFGAEHLMQDTAAARAYLRYELSELGNEEIRELGMPLREPTGFRHRFVRINLAMVVNGEMSSQLVHASPPSAAPYASVRKISCRSTPTRQRSSPSATPRTAKRP